MTISNLFEPSQISTSNGSYPFGLFRPKGLKELKWCHVPKDSTPLSKSQLGFDSIKRPASYSTKSSMWDMDTKQIRKRNLENLRDKYKEKCARQKKLFKLKEFASAYHIEARTCSQILNGHVGLGVRLARQIEQAPRPKLPFGWMDVPHPSSEPTTEDELEFQEAFLTIYRAHPEEARKLLIKMVQDMLREKEE